jgi:indole-3-glycerol phosphate synthase
VPRILDLVHGPVMLNKILAAKRVEIAALNVSDLRSAALAAPNPRPFLAAPSRGRVQLIAELKRASPSRGPLAPNIDLFEVARIYAENGAAAISVLTDEEFFMGRLETLRELRVQGNVPPLLRKDFIISAVQLYQTRAAGADAVLLIVAALPSDGPEAGSLPALHALALELGLTPLVEVHALPELERALRLPGLRLVGINNRDLSNFEVRLETTLSLRGQIPAGVRVVSESGIFSAADVERLAAAGVDAVLVGEALITAPDIGAKVRELSGVPIAGGG